MRFEFQALREDEQVQYLTETILEVLRKPGMLKQNPKGYLSAHSPETFAREMARDTQQILQQFQRQSDLASARKLAETLGTLLEDTYKAKYFKLFESSRVQEIVSVVLSSLGYR
ncbi:MAG TPA: hypothetical protein PLF96_07425 [Thermotogota bacterium]|nr:hypothetical protein [Thermotogota bacterium]